MLTVQYQKTAGVVQAPVNHLFVTFTQLFLIFTRLYIWTWTFYVVFLLVLKICIVSSLK